MRPKNELLVELQGLLTGYWLTDLANFSAFFYEEIESINWIGFYLDDGERLRLGPFAGKAACVEIDYDRGVCGAAFRSQRPLIVDDVRQFPGHIACDSESRSELVLPFSISKNLAGVLDIDSPRLARFTQVDRDFFSQSLQILQSKMNSKSLVAKPF